MERAKCIHKVIYGFTKQKNEQPSNKKASPQKQDFAV